MHVFRPHAAAASALLLLAACGGGGSPSDGSMEETPGDSAVAEQPGTATPDDSATPGNGPPDSPSPFETAASRQLSLELTRLLRGGDTYVLTDALSSLNRKPQTDSGDSYALNSYVDDDGEIENIATMPPVQDDGVWLFQSRLADCNDDDCSAPVTHAENYGGWLDHSFFYVTFMVNLQTFSFLDDEAYSGWSFGDDTGSVPVDGSANWAGLMVAADFQRQEIVRGDAELTVNFGASSVDVAFTDIRELDTGAERAAIRFDAVPLSARGFQSGADGHRITGTFYGPAHAEAGGVFEHEHTVGAFGATRQDP